MDKIHKVTLMLTDEKQAAIQELFKQCNIENNYVNLEI